jgi:hypothetical protein
MKTYLGLCFVPCWLFVASGGVIWLGVIVVDVEVSGVMGAARRGMSPIV